MPKLILKPLLTLCLECIYCTIEASCLCLLMDESNADDVVTINQRERRDHLGNLRSEMSNASNGGMESTIIDYRQEIKINPFHQLPTELLQEIVNNYTTLKYPKAITHKVIQNLITPQLKHLRFHYYDENYLSLFPNFGNVAMLDLKGSEEVGDDCLKIIGINCKKLRILDISGCCKVTDTGIQWLCVVSYADPLNMENGIQSESCKTLRRLTTMLTSVTKRGIYIALKNLFALESLEHEKTFQVVIDFFREAYQYQHLSEKCANFPNLFDAKLTTQTNSNLSFGRLRNFINFNSLRRSDCLGQMVIQLCPPLYSLCITEKELLNTDLLRFVGHLKELRCLILIKETSKEDFNDIIMDKSLLFHYKLVPILEIIGDSLESLEISVDISAIISLCPNLTYLSLYETHCINDKDLSIMTISKRNHLPIMEEKHLVFSNELKCVGFCGPELSSDTLKYFVLHFSLVEIIFCRCHFISDDFLKETAQCGRFQNTEEFTFWRCDSVTIQGIKTLMIDLSSLKIISITTCKNITLNDMYDLKALALEKKWSLRIYFENRDTECWM